MTFQEILAIVNEEKRVRAFNSYDDTDNLSSYQKIQYIVTLKSKEHVLELLQRDDLFDKDVFVYCLTAVFPSDIRYEFAHDGKYEWLRNKVKTSNLSASNIESIMAAFPNKKDALQFFDKNASYYKKNEELILRASTKKYNDNVVDRIGKIEDNEKIDTYKKSNLMDLLSVNEDALKTVDFNILDSKYARLKKHITVISRYPKIQESILKLTNNELNLVCDTIDYFDERKFDWIPVMDDLLQHIKEYSTIINNDLDRNSSRYKAEIKNNPKVLMKIIAYFVNPNKYDFSNLNDLLKANRKELAGKILNNEFFTLSDSDKYRQLLFEKVYGIDLKDATRMYEYYCMDYPNVVKEAMWDDDRIDDYLRKIKNVTPTDNNYDKERYGIEFSNTVIRNFAIFSHKVMNLNVHELKDFYDNIDTIPEQNIPKSLIDSLFREYFTRLMNETLYIPNEKNAIKIDGEKAYLMPHDARMILTSLEAYTKFNEKKKSAPDWFSKSITSHLIHCVYVGADNYAHPPINGVNYCFAKLDSRFLVKQGPYDLGGWAYNKEFDSYKKQAEFKPKFATPQTHLNEIMRRHGEIIGERENYNYYEDSIFKLPPSYTNSFVEPPLECYFKRPCKDYEVLTTKMLKSLVDYDKMSDIDYRQNIITEELRKDEKWTKTLKNVKENKIPYMTIADITHSLLTERILMDRKESELLGYCNKELDDPQTMEEFLQLIEEIIVDFDRVRAGTVQREVLDWTVTKWGVPSVSGDIIHKEMYYKLFSKKVMDDKLYNMEKKFKKLDPDKYKMCMEKMQQVVRKQINKLENQYWWYECDPAHDWNHYFNYAARELAGIPYEKDNDVIKDLLSKDIPGTGLNGGQLVNKTIAEIEKLNEYDIPKGEPDWHGRRHINNVALFAYLIAQKDNKIPDKIDLLMQAAKYHDVGRDGIWNGLGEGKRHDKDEVPHAYPSALAAEFYMKKELNRDGTRKYSDDEIAMVKVAIEYHEVYEKDKNIFNNDVFENLCNKEKVKFQDEDACKKMCLYLKDADALDRTRFMLIDDNNVGNYKFFQDNLDYRYLHSNIAVALRDFSRDINEHHYINKSGKLYIPEILDNYRINYNPSGLSKRQLAKEAAEFMSNKDLNFNPSKPNSITIDNIRRIMGINPKISLNQPRRQSGGLFWKNKDR